MSILMEIYVSCKGLDLMTSLATIMVFPHRMCFGTLNMRVEEGS